MKKMTSLTLAGIASALLISCSAEKVDLGNDQPPAESQASLVAYAGDWVGYAEGFNFKDDSDRVRIVIDEEGKGSIEFGDSPPPPKPEPNRGYPTASFERAGLDYFWPGFAYPLLEASVEDSRLRLRTHTVQLFAGWCPLFEPVLIENAFPQFYGCKYAGGFGIVNDTECQSGPRNETFECGLANCGRACKCDAQSCGLSEDGSPIRFDGALEQDGKKLTGTLVKGDQRIILRLTRG